MSFPLFKDWVKEFVSEEAYYIFENHTRPAPWDEGRFSLTKTDKLIIPYERAVKHLEDLEAWAMIYEGVYQLWEDSQLYYET